MITPGGRPGDSSPLGHKGKRRLDDYVRAVAHALMREHGFTKSHAIATAKNSLKKWSRGGGKVRPQVRAGAAAHLATQKAIDVSLAVPFGASAQDGPRVTMGGVQATRKRRPGSIASGPGKGKFPIRTQKDVRSAASLLHKAKGVSQATIKAHVKAEIRRRGLKPTKTFDGSVVDLVGPKGYSHGWVRAGGPVKVPKGGKSRATAPAGVATGRAKTRAATPQRQIDQHSYAYGRAHARGDTAAAQKHAQAAAAAHRRRGNAAGAKEWDRAAADAARAGSSSPFAKLAADMKAGKHGPEAQRAVIEHQKPHTLGSGGGVHGARAAALTPAAEAPPFTAEHSMAQLRGKLASKKLKDEHRAAIKAEIERRKGASKAAKAAPKTEAQKSQEHQDWVAGQEAKNTANANTPNAPKQGTPMAAADAFVARAPEAHLRAMLADPRYKSWTAKINAELAKRRGSANPIRPGGSGF